MLGFLVVEIVLALADRAAIDILTHANVVRGMADPLAQQDLAKILRHLCASRNRSVTLKFHCARFMRITRKECRSSSGREGTVSAHNDVVHAARVRAASGDSQEGQ